MRTQIGQMMTSQLASMDVPEAMSEFYKSPTGRAFANKLPILTKRMMEISQTRVQTLVPRIKKMNDEFVASLKGGTKE